MNVLQLNTQVVNKPVNRNVYPDLKFSVNNRYTILKILGKGSYGLVCAARDNHTGNQQIAIKKIVNIFNREILLKRSLRELKFMDWFKGHKNIVNLINVELILNDSFEGLYCYQDLIEYDLAKIIHSNVPFTEFHIKFFIYQIFCGLKFIHSANVIHRDLKPGNILCTLNGCLKICDFGLARGLNNLTNSYNKNNNNNNNNTGTASNNQSDFFNYTNQHITNYVATRWYRAPELILSNKIYGKSIDIWAVGCILAEFYYRKPIFMGKDSMDQIDQIIKLLNLPPKYLLLSFSSIRSWNLINGSHKCNYMNCTNSNETNERTNWKSICPHASTEAIHLIKNLLKWDPNDRYNIEDCLEHTFVQSVRKFDDEPVHPLGEFDANYENELDSMGKLKNYLIKEVETFKK